jgi:hypothetical protein
LTPDQAAGAAATLGTKIACPMHYGAFHNPPVYVRCQPLCKLSLLHLIS